MLDIVSAILTDSKILTDKVSGFLLSGDGDAGAGVLVNSSSIPMIAGWLCAKYIIAIGYPWFFVLDFFLLI